MNKNIFPANIRDLTNSDILENVEYFFQVFFDDNNNKLITGTLLKSIFLEFKTHTFTLTIFQDDDSIEIFKNKKYEETENGFSYKYKVLLVNYHKLWKKAIGTDLILAWKMTNNQGYTDGIQLEFKDVIIQIMAIASEIKLFHVKTIEQLKI